MLFTFIASIVANILDAILGTDIDGSTSGVVATMVSLAVLVPSLAVGARRLHDTGRSGWWQLPLLVFILIGLIIWWATDTKPGDNNYGPDPKNQGSTTPDHGQSSGYGDAPPSGPIY